MFKKHGATTIRNFDALNEVNNLIYAGQMIQKHGLRHEICIALMGLPPGCAGAHDTPFYMKTLDDILDSGVGFDLPCFKDASGTATPSMIYESIKEALNAGADGIDLSMAPMSGGASQPDIVTMWHALRGTDYELGLDIDKVLEAEKVFQECMDKYETLPEGRLVEPLVVWSPMPGGALPPTRRCCVR